MPNRPKSYDDTRESGLAGVLACFDGLHGDCLRLPSGHSLQLPKRIKRSERDEFEAHQVRLAERQLLEHVVRGSRVGYVQEERDAASTLKREPLIDLAIEIELHRFADFVRQD
jgi:hypothetical protein